MHCINYVHIATEVLETLHSGVIGLCFIMKVWLVTLIGLTNSHSTSNLSEMVKNVHMFLIKAANSLLLSHPGPPIKMSDCLIQIPICPANLEWSTDAYSSLFVTTDYTLFDFVGHPIFQLESLLMTIILNQTTRRQTLWRNVKN